MFAHWLADYGVDVVAERSSFAVMKQGNKTVRKALKRDVFISVVVGW